MLLRQFCKLSRLVTCYLFNTYCSNLYCASLWYSSTVTAIKKLKIVYNNSIRRLCVFLNIIYFGELLRKSTSICNFCFRLSSSLNSVINNIYLSIVLIYLNLWAL